MNIHIKSGLIIILFFLFITIVYIMFFNFNIDIDINSRFENFSINHILGTDNLGRDIMSSIIFGFWFSLFIALIITSLSSTLGIILGTVSGYFGGILDTVIMRTGDVLLAFPGFLLVIIWISVLGNGFLNMILIMSFMSWVVYARLVRGEVLKNKNKDFVLAAISYNASHKRVIIFHILPQIVPVIIVQVSMELSNIIIIESSLNFLGLGTGSDYPSLGQLVYYGQRFIFFKPDIVIFAGLSLFFLIISINLISEGFRLRRKI